MFEIESKARELADILISSDAYKRYEEARQRLEKEGELQKAVNEYRKRRFYIQNNPDENMQNALSQLFGEYSHVVNNAIAKEYLDSESLICREVRKITAVIADSINIDMNFLD